MLQLREGDSNTRFFHKMANSNRRNNGIKNLLVNGSLSSNKNLIVNCITQFFMDLYSEQQVDWHFPDVLEFPTISRDNASWLRDLLRRQRYLKSLRISMVTNRLGQMVFPWHFWEILKPNLMAVFHHIFCSSSVCKKLECNLHYSHSKKNYYSRSQGLSTY